MRWPEHVTTDTLRVVENADQPMTARDVADAIVRAAGPDHAFYGRVSENFGGVPVSGHALWRRVKLILRTHEAIPDVGRMAPRLRLAGRVADGNLYLRNV